MSGGSKTLEELAGQYPQIYEKITGKGLFIGMHFKNSDVGYQVAAKLFKSGVLVSIMLAKANKTVRIEPPLVTSMEQLNQVFERLDETLKSVSRSMVHGRICC